MLDLRGGLKNSCDVYFYEVARRTGIDRIAAMANRLGLGVELELDLPGQRRGPDPDAGVAHQQGPCLEHGRHRRQRDRPGVHPGDAAATGDLCRAHRQRAAGAAASDAQARRRAAAGRRTGGLAGAGHAGKAAAHRAGGHVGGGERAGRHRAAGQAGRSTGADGRQDRLGAGAPRVPRTARKRAVRQRETALGVPPARAVRRLRAV